MHSDLINGWIHVLASTAYIVLGLFVFYHNPKRKTNVLFLLFSLSMGLNSFFHSFRHLSVYYFDTIWLWGFQLDFLFGALVPATGLTIALSFPEYPSWFKKKYLFFLFAPSIYFIFLAISLKYFSPLYCLNHVLYKKETIYYLIDALCYCLPYLLLALTTLIIKRITANTKILKKQLTPILLGTALGGFITIIFGMVLSSLLIDTETVELGYFIMLSFISYSMIRYQAFDVITAFHYTLLWLFSLVLIFLPIIGIPLLFKATFIHHKHQLFALIGWGIITVIYFMIISKLILPLINHFTLRKKNLLAFEAQKLIEQINACSTYQQTIKVIQQSLKNNLYSEDCLIMFLNEKNILVGSFDNELAKIELPVEELNFLNGLDDLLNQEFVQDLGAEAQFFKDHKIILISKLVFEHKLLGLLCLKQKKNLKSYTLEEHRFIRTISQGIAALFNKNLLVQRASDVASEIIHEIKNTVQSLEYTLSELTAKTDLPTDDKEQLQEVFTELTKLHQFSKKHLSMEMLNKMDSLEKKYFELSLLINEAKATLQFQLSEKQMVLRIDVPEKTTIFGDPILLKIVLVNLLENAIKFSDSQNFIDILYSEDEANQIILVQDYGQGISEEKQDKLFKKWVKDGSGKYMSSGFGLALARNIILKHGGKISFTSQPGKGAVFAIHLPKRSRYA